MPAYTNQGPVNCEVDFDTSNVKGKTAIVTGGKTEACSSYFLIDASVLVGANGIGEAYVIALAKAG